MQILVVMLTTLWSLSCQGQPKPRFHTEDWLHDMSQTVTWTICRYLILKTRSDEGRQRSRLFLQMRENYEKSFLYNLTHAIAIYVIKRMPVNKFYSYAISCELTREGKKVQSLINHAVYHTSSFGYINDYNQLCA